MIQPCASPKCLLQGLGDSRYEFPRLQKRIQSCNRNSRMRSAISLEPNAGAEQGLRCPRAVPVMFLDIVVSTQKKESLKPENSLPP